MHEPRIILNGVRYVPQTEFDEMLAACENERTARETIEQNFDAMVAAKTRELQERLAKAEEDVSEYRACIKDYIERMMAKYPDCRKYVEEKLGLGL